MMTHLQGAVPLNDPSYVDRKFQRDTIRELQAGRWVLLLGPRQHGKTSALYRVRDLLADGGALTAIVDLQKIPPCASYRDLVLWFTSEVGSQLPGANPPSGTDDLGDALASVLPHGAAKVVILVDEASNIARTEWRHAFYGQLRAIANARADAKDDAAPARLRFLFAGTFKPEALIDDANSPFNTSERIETEDITLDGVKSICRACGINRQDEVAHLIYGAVGGQPFLCQKLISAAEGEDDEIGRVEEALEHLRSGGSDHISTLFAKILSDTGVAKIVSQAAREGSTPNEIGNPDYKFAQVLGVMRRQERSLVFRNPLYEEVARQSAQIVGTGQVEGPAPLFDLMEGAFGSVRNERLREIASSAHRGAIAAYRGRSNRLALAGLGGSLEAILIDVLDRAPEEDRQKAIQDSGAELSRKERASGPYEWRLVNLIKIAGALPNGGRLDPPQNLREWRNLIHPAVCLGDYQEDSALGAEVRVAAAMHEIVLRDLV